MADFEKTFKSYEKMTKGEKNAYLQGIHTNKSQIRNAFGLSKKKTTTDK